MTQIDRPSGSDSNTPHIFFSYSREDKARATPIIRALEASGIEVWWDGLLDGGAKYIEQTEQALHSAYAVVVLWSKASITSHWVQDEAMHGRDQKRLVPIGLDSVDPPLGFRQFQVIDFSKWDGSQTATPVRNVVRTLEALRGNAPAPIETIQETLLERLSRRRVMLLGAALGTATVGTLAVTQPWRGGTSRTSDGSIAVLPFENDSRDPDKDYLSSGLANELRNALARNDGLRVMARSTSEDVKERKLTPDLISRELGVAFVVEGAVQVADGIVNVTSSLIEGATELTLWSETYSQPLDGLLDMQRQMADAISAELTLGVSTALGQSNIGAASNPVAYDSYLRGWTIYRGSNSTETDLLALERFDNAIRLDPKFAAAHAARSVTLVLLGNTSDNKDQARIYYDQAIEAANRAVELGPDLDEAHSVLGLALFESQLDIKAARPVYERSLELGRGSAVIQARYAEYAALTGRDADAQNAIEFGLSLDPLNPTIFRSAAIVHYAARRFDQAIEASNRALALNANTSDVHAWSGASHLLAGRPDRALESCLKEPHELFADPCLAIVYHRQGEPDLSSSALAKLVSEYGDSSLYQQAQVLAQTGAIDDAMATLQRAFDFRDAGLTYLKMDPFLDPLRAREDFISLQNQLGFT